MIEKYQQLPLAYHRSTPTGELLAHAEADVDASTDLLHPLPYSAAVLLIIVIATVALVVTDWVLAIVGLALIPALALLNVVLHPHPRAARPPRPGAGRRGLQRRPRELRRGVGGQDPRARGARGRPPRRPVRRAPPAADRDGSGAVELRPGRRCDPQRRHRRPARARFVADLERGDHRRRARPVRLAVRAADRAAAGDLATCCSTSPVRSSATPGSAACSPNRSPSPRRAAARRCRRVPSGSRCATSPSATPTPRCSTG